MWISRWARYLEFIIKIIYKNPKNESTFYRRHQYAIGGIIIFNYYIPAIFISTLKNYVM